MIFKIVLIAVLFGSTAITAQAEDFKQGDLAIGRPHARATATGQSVGGAYLTLDNRGTDDRLLSASALVSGRVELHEMSMQGDVMKMRQLDAIQLPAGKTVELKPGGLHLMFVGLKAPLKAGDRFPMTLKFEKAGEVTVTVTVDAPGTDQSVHRH